MHMQFEDQYSAGLDDLYVLLRDIFSALAITCALWAMHRIGGGLNLCASVKALDSLGPAYTAEEREVLIHKIKRESLRY
jgi:hypothetical protein